MDENQNTEWRTRVITYVGVGLTVWACLYIAFWMRRSGCHVQFTTACNDALLEPLESFVSLWWVREYQELLGALLALAAALFVGLPVHKQLREMRRQSSAAAIVNIRDVAQELEHLQEKFHGERRHLQRIQICLWEYNNAGTEGIQNDWFNSSDIATAALLEITTLLQRSINRATTQLTKMEAEGIMRCTALRDALHDFALQVALTKQAELHGNKAPNTDIQTPSELVAESWREWNIWWQQYESDFNQNTAAIWRKVRALERDAVGDSHYLR